ncbi:MAG TPA: response regulator [Chloroflexota bacterium]|jgi:DNA-binding response OmpR family regulator|nr:response regulator [Chloroflexota bacterium]
MERAPRLDRTALVVDDDAFVVSALGELLSEIGYDVHTASNGFSALRQAIDSRPSLILLDVVLPERSGREVLAELRSHAATRDAAIVIVSGHLDELSEVDLAEADGVVGKPFDIDDLSMTVHRAIQRAANRRAEVAPVSAAAHREAQARARRTADVRHSRGRR